jgi:uncharacterized alpha-E superfamily protein
MLSRVADAIYWMSRYVERAENIARFIDVNLALAIDLPEADEHWMPLVQAAGDEELFKKAYGDDASRANVLRFLTFDRTSPNSILSSLAAARQNARTVREVISSEMFEQVNKTYLAVRDASATGAALETPHDFFTSVKQASQLLVGITYVTMTHNEAWHFGRLGRLVERADQTTRILDVKHFMSENLSMVNDGAVDEVQWSALLRSASAFEMYRKRFGQVAPQRVIEYLLFSRRFPRSVRYCLRKAERSLHAITGSPIGTASTSAERALGRLAAEVEYGDINEVLNGGLHGWLDELQIKMNRVGNAIFETFFAAAVAPVDDQKDQELEARYPVESIRPREG